MIKLNTKEFTDLLLHNPDKIFTFATKPDEKELFYGIVCAKLFDVQSIFMNYWTIDGGVNYSFDIPCYDKQIFSNESSLLNDYCTNDVINKMIKIRDKLKVLDDSLFLLHHHF